MSVFKLCVSESPLNNTEMIKIRLILNNFVIDYTI